MPRTGGRTPYDSANALTGPARVVYAPMTVGSPIDLWAIVAAVAVAGEYPLTTGWKDFGLAADAPSYTHSREAEGIEYQQPTAPLFESISNIQRQFTAQVAEIEPDNMKIVENSAATTQAIAASANKSAQQKLGFGLYSQMVQYRIALISFRPGGIVTEPGGVTRPPAVALVLPTCSLAAEDTEIAFEAGTPVNAPITFSTFPTTGLAAGLEHGYWIFENPGVIAAV